MVRFLVPSVFDPGQPAVRAGADPVMLLHREMNRLFDDTLRGTGPVVGAGTVAPRMNVSETDQEFRITAELPGVRPEDVQVELADDALTIRGEKRAERADAQHHVAERSFGTFARTVHLPFAPDADRVRADFEHGVLHVTVPKVAPRARSRRIPVQSASGAAAGQSGDSRNGHGPQAAVAGHPTPETTQSAGTAPAT